jgi:hypothetical protein
METAIKLFRMSPMTHSFFLKQKDRKRNDRKEGKKGRKGREEGSE